MVEILKDNARPEAGAVYAAMDMPWAKLVGQIAQAYGRVEIGDALGGLTHASLQSVFRFSWEGAARIQDDHLR
jgi:hypothetical protein